MTTASIWSELGIPPTRERAVIRRAYASRLKSIDPESDAAGFQNLRAAYERALRLAESQEDAPPTTVAAIAPAQPGAVAPEHPEPELPPAATGLRDPAHPAQPHDGADHRELAAARAAFSELAAGLSDTDTTLPASASAQFDAVVSAVSKLDVTQQYQAESALADLLIRHSPHADPLLIRAADRFGWRESGRGAKNTLGGVVIRLQALELESKLASGGHPLSRAYRILKRQRQNAVRQRIEAFLFDRHVAELLDAVAAGQYGLMPSLNSQACQWWQEHLDAPRVTRGTLAIAGIVALLVGVVIIVLGMSEGTPPGTLLSHASGGALAAGILSVPAKLYLMDWPRWRVRQRWAQRLPPLVAYGWFPAGFVPIFAAGFLPSNWSLYASLPAATAIAVWAYVAEPGPRGAAAATVTFRARFPVVKARLLLNIPIVVYLLYAASRPGLLGSSLTALMQVSAVTLGYAAIVRAWELDHPRRERWSILAILLLVSSGVCAAAMLNRLGSLRTEVALTTALVMAQRPISAAIRGKLLKVRYYILFFSLYVVRAVLPVSGNPSSYEADSFVHTASTWFAFGVVVSAVFAIISERRAAAEAA